MFGKVYTAVNMDTGAYMAMKEVSADDNDIVIIVILILICRISCCIMVIM